MNSESFKPVKIQDQWYLSLANESRYGKKCSVCQREGFSLNYSEVWVELERDDLAIIKREGWPATIGSTYHVAVRQDFMEWLSQLPRHGLAFHPLEVLTTKPTSDPPAYWLLEPLGEFDIVIPEEEFEVCPACFTATQKVVGDIKAELVAPRESWSGHAFAHTRNFRPWLTYMLADVADAIAARWPGALRTNKKQVVLR